MPSSIINKSLSLDLPLAVSIGEPSGIGPEVILKCWLNRHSEALHDFFVIGSSEILKRTAQQLKLDVPIRSIADPDEAASVFQIGLPVLDLSLDHHFEFGIPSKNTAPLVLQAIEKAVDLIFNEKAAGLVTAPIQKSVLYEAGFNCPGHTEFLADLCEAKTGKSETSVMMLASGQLRVVPLTIHMALSKVASSITPDLIKTCCHKIHHALRMDFGIDNPRIAVAGLNPHAGEGGAMGDEEKNILIPALEELRDKGMNILGPLPADTMFHSTARTQYDTALCMYHDQALIPLKTLDFDGGVNITIGLPIIRTSPDHGTALNIAGQNRASATSMINALKQAQNISLNRKEWAAKHV